MALSSALRAAAAGNLEKRSLQGGPSRRFSAPGPGGTRRGSSRVRRHAGRRPRQSDPPESGRVFEGCWRFVLPLCLTTQGYPLFASNTTTPTGELLISVSKSFLALLKRERRSRSASISCMSSSVGFMIPFLPGMTTRRTLQEEAQRLKAGPDTARLRPGLPRFYHACTGWHNTDMKLSRTDP